MVGPAPEDSRFKIVLERFFPIPAVFSLAFLVGLAVVLVVHYPRTRSTREAAEAALQHEAQVERAARAAATGQGHIGG